MFLYCEFNFFHHFDFSLVFLNKHFFFVSPCERRMADQPDTFNLDILVFDGNNSERRPWSCIGHSCSRSLIVFSSQYFVVLLIFLENFSGIHLARSCDVTSKRFGLELYVAQQDLSFPLLDYEQPHFHEKPCFHFPSTSRRIGRINC